MKHTLPFSKEQAKALLGGSCASAAVILKYKSRQAVASWPEILSYQHSLMVLGALWLQELDANDHAPAPRPARPAKRTRTRWILRRAA